VTVLTQVAVAATVDALVTKVRRYIGDTSMVDTLQRFSATDIMAAIDDMLAQMYAEIASADASGFLRSTDMTYTASADREPLPAGYEGDQIYRVEDLTTVGAPAFLAYLGPLDARKFTDSYGWTLEGNAIVLIPKPTEVRTLRLWSLAPFVPVSDSATPSSDQHSLSMNHEELIALGAAIRLQEIDDEVPASRLVRFQQLWDLYTRTCEKYRGPVYVRSSRIGLV
jgi:hypothetical protein